VAECSHEDPERCGVQQPVCGGPSDRPPQQGPVLHEDGEPLRQPLDQGGRPVGIEEPDPLGDAPDDAAGPLLAACQEVEEAPEGSEQDHADSGGNDHQDRGGLRLASVMAGRGMESMGHEERHQGEPEDDIEHHGRADALGPEGESGVRSGHS